MWQPRRWFKDRYSDSRDALDRPVPKIVLGLFFIAGAWDTFVAQFLPKECAHELPTVYDVAIMTGGLLPWYWWVIVGLTLLLGIVFEYSFRQRHSPSKTSVSGEQLSGRRTAPAASATTPMAGIAELDLCQKALVKYMAIPSQSIGESAQIAGSAELYPHMATLCGILDEQGIPHPEIDYYLTIGDTGPWAKFLGDLWAVRHDIEQAQRVYQGDSRTRLDDEGD